MGNETNEDVESYSLFTYYYHQNTFKSKDGPVHLAQMGP